MNKTIILIFLFFSISILNAQQQIIPEKKIYKDSENKIFVNKSLPLYFKISISPSKDSEHKLLISETTPHLTNPLYLGKEGKNVMFSPWAVDTVTKKIVSPKQNVYFELYADSRPPKTTIQNNITAYEKKDSLFFGNDLKIWFEAKDELCGLEYIYISVNNSPYEQYPFDTLTFEHGNTYNIKYYSTDLVGNVEDIQEVSFSIDTGRPLTNLMIIGEHKDNIVSGNCKVSLKPIDAFSGSSKTYYYIDNEQKKIYTAPISVSGLKEGRHILKYYTEDNVLNIEKEKVFEFYIDKTPPVIINDIIGDFVYVNGKAYTSGRSQLQLTSIDNRAGVQSIYYSFDNKNWTMYEKPVDLPKDNKNISIYYYAVDNVGNKTNSDLSNVNVNKFFMSEMDLLEPKISYKFIGPQKTMFDTICISPKTQINLSAFDNQSGVEYITYQIGKEQTTNFSEDFSIKDNGYFQIFVNAVDKVNNIAMTSFNLNVDSIGPEIYPHFSSNPIILENKKTFSNGTKLFLAATDITTGVEKITYKINEEEEKLYSSEIIFSKSGDYVIVIYAYDLLGNTNVNKISFQIK